MSWVIDGGIFICMMLTVLSEVESALRVILADQFGASVKMFVIYFKIRVTFIRRQPTELVSVIFAARNRASLSLLHTFQKILSCAFVRPDNGFGIGFTSQAARLASLEDADCLVFVFQSIFVGVRVPVGVRVFFVLV